ncbi:MAG: TIGR03668 family PPOX class F420-dependent oxidoreductase [SAR202 cluster bacterium]|nr:TIGR03668 family PPOX class F420-dependent oxidoreductase [Dehalococcoidia bacterium]MQF91114.1 TIGR03668 family PPOX class F420-dependent oxidoreductase [SAR202 cluster bacterium]MQG13858.1 TIGR03668 family PPOX class F420-dependent oxidoreductase [SAR202 cluster bacterium]MQG31381.1 TIGR03668 family PPOX class F420-dependent oxidoreductase [SAR202 cluster bacterium]MQG42473.1 TIGR03668 family PPOX class F420-dependent oxidoreductase [SAR202 cluster bacterium]
MTNLSPAQDRFLRSARTGHLATADAKGRPQVVPVCFVFDGQAIYSVLDAKPKTTPLRQLRRVKNILANPQVSLVVDHYEENWDKLQYILVSGDAELLESDEKWVVAIAMLREKYPQYQAMDLDQSPVIKITPVRYSPWSSQPPP